MQGFERESKIQELRETNEIANALGLPLSRFLPRRYKPRGVDSWTGHLAFASDLIVATQPQLIVELGTHWGEAYFTFCQTVQEHGLSSLCYAVDHWLGDEHAGYYGEEVFEDVLHYNRRFYKQFSYLLRASFDDAVSQFNDHSIGLLHIDGLHTYEAVTHDFRTWLPKVKPGGIVLLHDICPKDRGFGVWRLWNEIKAEFPNTFEFHHSWGLGVIYNGDNPNSSSFTDCLFGCSPSSCEEIRRRYVVYSSHLENLLNPSAVEVRPETTRSSKPSGEIRVQVFPFGASGYSEERAVLHKMEAGTWNTLVFELPDGVGTGPLRVDPGNEPSIVEVGDILIHSIASGELLWSASASSGRDSLAAFGTAELLSSEAGLFLASSGDDPQLMVSVPPSVQGPVRLSVSFKISPTSVAVLSLVRAMAGAAHDSAEQQATAAQAVADQQIAAAQAKANELVAAAQAKANQQVAAAQAGFYQQLAAARMTAEQMVAAARLERDSFADQLDRANAETASKQQLLLKTEENLRQEQATRVGMQRSLSWRVTEPMRTLMNTLRSGPRKT